MKSVSGATDRVGDITLKQVSGFLAASACSTFMQAAPRAFLSQTAFRRVIQELESSLGEDLFIRTSQGISLSSAGKAFLPYAQQLIRCYSTALAGMAKWRATGLGQLVLAGSHTVMPTVLAMLLSRMRSNFDSPSLLYEEGTSHQVIGSVLQGHADCGVCTVLGEQPELHCTALLQAPLGLLVSPDLVLPASICALADLDGINLARYSDDSVVSKLLQSQATPFEAYHASRLVCGSMPAAYAMVRGGQVAAITSGIGATHPQARGLRFVPLPGLLPTLSVNLISKRDTHLNDQQALMKELTRVCVLETQWHPSVSLCRPMPLPYQRCEEAHPATIVRVEAQPQREQQHLGDSIQ